MKSYSTDLVNVVLTSAMFWAFGFRTVFECGYSQVQKVSQYYCKVFLAELVENNPECTYDVDKPDVFPEACSEVMARVPAFAEPLRKVGERLS